MRHLTSLFACAAGAVGLASSAVAVDWQFTGATNRTAVAVQAGAFAGAFSSAVPAARIAAAETEFDSRLPSVVRLSGRNMRSDAAGTLLLFR